MKHNQSSISTDTVETTDLVELIRNGPTYHTPMYEQEINFDAGYTPEPHVWNNVEEVWIEGKKYIAYS